MQPNNFRFGGGLHDSLLHPVVLVAMLLAILLIWTVPRKYMVIPFLVVVLLLSLGQQIYAGGVHWFVGRLLVLAIWVRILLFGRSYRQLLAGGWTRMDTAFLVWGLAHSFASVLLLKDFGAVINQVGFLWDTLGGYFLLRFLVRDESDLLVVIRTLAAIAIVVAVGMLNEHFRAQNVFGYLGDIRIVPEVREGSLRSQGPFDHPLLAGSFGATLLPLFVWMWSAKKGRMLAAMGVLSSLIIAATSACSTPILALAAGVMLLCFWPIRSYLHWARWGIVVLLVGLHLVMKAPVWFLIARVDLVGGSSGYHRAMLIDQFIRNFFSWWLIGTTDNGSWGFDMWDTCNQFVQEGLNGGLIAFIAFLAVIVIGFRRLARARKIASAGQDRSHAWMCWCLSAALFSHVVAFFGIAYFDQTKFSWFAFLAMIPAVTVLARVAATKEPRPVPLPELGRQEGLLAWEKLPQRKFDSKHSAWTSRS